MIVFVDDGAAYCCTSYLFGRASLGPSSLPIVSILVIHFSLLSCSYFLSFSSCLSLLSFGGIASLSLSFGNVGGGLACSH